MLNKILAIEEIKDLELKAKHKHEGSTGFNTMLNMLVGYGSYDGYKVKTKKYDIYILIDNCQSCCESWGYFSTNDNLEYFIGANLINIELTDTALTAEPIDEIEYLDMGGVQFVTFKTDRGIFQLAVYNAHNGYYGHGIYVVKGNHVLLNSVI